MSLSKPCAMPERRIVPAPATSDIGVLPLDALFEILLRFQAKELCRLRLVCRLWRSLLSDPYFAAAHDARHQVVLIIAGYKDDAGRDVLVDIMDVSGQIVKKVHRMEGDRTVSVALEGVCVRKIDDSCSSYRLFNPIRQELYYLPDRLLDPATGPVYRIPDSFAEEHVELASSLVTEPKYLFGQVARTGEYKIFRMLFHFSIGNGGQQMFEVCTLNTNNSSSCAGWRRVAPLEEGIQMSRFTSVVVNGVVYCLCFDPHRSITFDNQVTEKDLIFTFDLETEAWGPSIRGPPITFPDDANLMFYCLGLPHVRQLTVANLNRFLSVVHGPAPYIDVWVLLDFAKGFWVKMYSIEFEEYAILRPVHPLFVFGDGRIILYKQDHDYLQIYDPRTNTLTNTVESKHFSAVARYAGNLLSLKC
ncbi:F-box/kelch-repeat protein At3g06240-like [Miscanthus floridulus]|uniref:F-box/kelch-repeat protein At3g06240-like n=1 Tax=Miscanthus floridulus TaxID=154761 RepID=UPI00345AE275